MNKLLWELSEKHKSIFYCVGYLYSTQVYFKGDWMKYRILLFDLDDTILDFGKAEEQAFYKTFEDNDLTVNLDMFNKYKEINAVMWKNHEKGLVSRDEIMVERYVKLFEVYNIKKDAVNFNREYLNNLSLGSFSVEGAAEFLKEIKSDFKIYAVTNGEEKTQKMRLKNSDVGIYLDAVITSEQAGFNKPQIEFFDYAFNKLKLTDKRGVLLIGDSLSADIKGAENYGLDSCWFNFRNKPKDESVEPNYEVKSFDELKKIIY